MKLKKLSLLASAIAVAFSITPFAANAQVNSNAPQRVSQANRPQRPPDLKLSDPQKQKLIEIRSNTRTQIQNVLTSEQRQKIQKDLLAGMTPQKVCASIQFTQKQQNQLRSIMVNSQKRMEAVLTPAQKKTLNQWRNNIVNQRRKK